MRAQPAPAAADFAPSHFAGLAIDVQGLWTEFPAPGGKVVIHQDLALRVEQGEIVSLVGGSGTGKTTLLREILGLDAPTRGRIRVMGQPAAALGGPDAASRVGMLFQRGALFSAFSVLDNIALALRELGTLPESLVRDAALLKLQMVGLNPADAFKMPAELSGGMVKRVALARALIMDPPLLLLDEPTAGLDPDASDAFCALLKSLHTSLGLTVVMVTHDLDTVYDLSTQVAVLADRHVIAYGPPQQVIRVAHPFVQEFFLGARGRRAMALLDARHAAPAEPAAAPVVASAAAPVARAAPATPTETTAPAAQALGADSEIIPPGAADAATARAPAALAPLPTPPSSPRSD